jgi:hypothetical protein
MGTDTIIVGVLKAASEAAYAEKLLLVVNAASFLQHGQDEPHPGVVHSDRDVILAEFVLDASERVVGKRVQEVGQRHRDP